MPIYEINGKKPAIGKGTWIAPSADIIGNVTIGENCYIGFRAIIRGDFGKITVGNHSLVEDAVVIHCANRVIIGNKVIIGHTAMLHDAHIKDNALVGMQSMICDHSIISEFSIIAEKSLVMKKQVIPPKKIYGGSPAREIGDVAQRQIEKLDLGIQAYYDLIRQYHQGFKKLDV